MLVKFEQNRAMIQTVQNFELFDKNGQSFFYKVLKPVWKAFLLLKELFDAKVLM